VLSFFRAAGTILVPVYSLAKDPHKHGNTDQKYHRYDYHGYYSESQKLTP
jgi:hypothetical protein